MSSAILKKPMEHQVLLLNVELRCCCWFRMKDQTVVGSDFLRGKSKTKKGNLLYSLKNDDAWQRVHLLLRCVHDKCEVADLVNTKVFRRCSMGTDDNGQQTCLYLVPIHAALIQLFTELLLAAFCWWLDLCRRVRWKHWHLLKAACENQMSEWKEWVITWTVSPRPWVQSPDNVQMSRVMNEWIHCEQGGMLRVFFHASTAALMSC